MISAQVLEVNHRNLVRWLLPHRLLTFGTWMKTTTQRAQRTPNPPVMPTVLIPVDTLVVFVQIDCLFV